MSGVNASGPGTDAASARMRRLRRHFWLAWWLTLVALVAADVAVTVGFFRLFPTAAMLFWLVPGAVGFVIQWRRAGYARRMIAELRGDKPSAAAQAAPLAFWQALDYTHTALALLWLVPGVLCHLVAGWMTLRLPRIIRERRSGWGEDG